MYKYVCAIQHSQYKRISHKNGEGYPTILVDQSLWVMRDKWNMSSHKNISKNISKRVYSCGTNVPPKIIIIHYMIWLNICTK